MTTEAAPQAVESQGSVDQAEGVDAQNGSSQAQPQSFGNVSGEEAVALVQEAEAKGISVKELMASKQKAPQKQPESTKQETKIEKEAVEKPEPRRFRVKIAGEEVEVDEDELVRGYSHQSAANKILQEGKMARKQAEEFITMMKNPEKYFEVAEKLGHNVRDLAEKFLASQLKVELMDPKDKALFERNKELEDVKKKLAAMEELEKKSQDALAKQRHDELKAKYAKDFESQFIQALQQVEVPATKETVAEMSKYISRAAKLKFKMSPLEAAKLVQEDMRNGYMRLFKNADANLLYKTFGDDVAKKLLQARGSQVKQPEQVTPKEQGPFRQRKPKAVTRMTPREWRDYNRA